MLRDFAICRVDPRELFQDWCPFRLRAWHVHPLPPTGDSIVTLDLASEGTRDYLYDLQAAGKIDLLPTVTSGSAIADAHAAHPTFKAAGVINGDRTWDAAKKLMLHLGWPPLHPEFTPRDLSRFR